MSELKTRFIDDTYVEYYNTGKHDLAQIYLKSEADAVIAEKDKEIAELKKERDWLAKDRAQAYDDLEKRAQLNIKQDAEIAELKAQKAQAEDDCAYWKAMAQKNAEDNVVMAKQRAEAFKRERHHKYKRCLAMALLCFTKGKEKQSVYKLRTFFWSKWGNRWWKLAEEPTWAKFLQLIHKEEK